MPPLRNYNNASTVEPYRIRRIVAFGDSLTEGFLAGGRKYYPFTTKLEEKLNNSFNFTRFEVLNEGISGECVFITMATRLPKLLDRIGDRIDLFIILGGTNDLYQLDCPKHVNVAYELISLHKMVHKAGIKSLVCTIPQCWDYDGKCEETRKGINKKLKQWAQGHQNNTLFLDLAAKLPMRVLSKQMRKLYWDDEVHPTRIGYEKIAELLFHVIKKMYESPKTDRVASAPLVLRPITQQKLSI